MTDYALTFDDVLLRPRLGVLNTRKDADLSTYLAPRLKMHIPIVSAPMSSVTEAYMAGMMCKAGGFGFIHRFMPVEYQVNEYRQVKDGDRYDAGCALGINEGYDRFNALFEAGCRVFCIDVAHAHHSNVEGFIKSIPHRENITLIVGNVATQEGACFLADLGVDAIKVGIGSGAACSTRAVTGFGVPQLSAIMECSVAAKEHGVTLIADGGIRTSGDIVKALAAGADSVMLGRLLAGTDEAPYPGEYYGMASERGRDEASGANGHTADGAIEGVVGTVEQVGPVASVLKQLTDGIRSGISYAGATNLEELRANAQFIKVSPLSLTESGVRI